jgi:uncharacterized delta-60 repeat protein
VVVSLDRPSTQTEDISVKVSGLIEGLSADPLTIKGTDRQGRLTIRSDSSTKQGPIDLELRGSTPSGTTATGTLPLFVRGKPGTVDPTFGKDGRRVGFNGGGATGLPTEVLVGADDQIYLVGPCNLPVGGVQACAVRMSADGALDPNYGGAARALSPEPFVAALDSVGRLVVAGWLDSRTALQRLNAAGTFDSEFATRDLPGAVGNSAAIGGIAVCANDILVIPYLSNSGQISVRKFYSTGDTVNEFGTGGLAGHSWKAGNKTVGAVCQSNGSVRFAGLTRGAGSGPYSVAAAQLTPTGSVDASFGGTGSVILGPDVDTGTRASYLELPDGRSAAAYRIGNVSVVVMFSAVGTTLDPSFGVSGVAQLPSGAGTSSGLARQSDGKLVVPFGGAGVERLVRLGPTGAPDPTFGGTGDVRTIASAETSTTRVAFQSDGRIVVAARNSANEFYVVRYWD